MLISGGVDSAVAAYRLMEQGHDLHLFYIRIGMDNGEGDCSAEEDIEMCRYYAKQFNLPLEVVSLHEEYWENVMEYALRTVRSGLTPNPDIMCNKMIKFGYFEERWGHEFDFTATGHYASTAIVDGVKYLATAVDPVKTRPTSWRASPTNSFRISFSRWATSPKAMCAESPPRPVCPMPSERTARGYAFSER